MRLISSDEVSYLALSKLGLDGRNLSIESDEAIAAILRRTAGFLCPCRRETLLRSIIGPRGPISNMCIVQIDDLKERTEALLDSLIGYGDIVECRKGDGTEKISPTYLYASPISFVCRNSGTALLVGISIDDYNPIPNSAPVSIEYRGHARWVISNSNVDVAQILTDLGISELSRDAWIWKPKTCTSLSLIDEAGKFLAVAGPAGSITSLQIIDPQTPVQYYRGRWTEPKSRHSGCFVGKRPGLYGTYYWCYVELKNGNPIRAIDLPFTGSSTHGNDVAWHLQAAIDKERGYPQIFREQQVPDHKVIFDFFSPIPGWAKKRWDIIGTPIQRPGCLFAYSFEESEATEESNFMINSLWLMKDVSG